MGNNEICLSSRAREEMFGSSLPFHLWEMFPTGQRTQPEGRPRLHKLWFNRTANKFCICCREIKCSLMKTLSFMRLKKKSVLYGDTAILYPAPPFRVAAKADKASQRSGVASVVSALTSRRQPKWISALWSEWKHDGGTVEQVGVSLYKVISWLWSSGSVGPLL